MSSLDQLMQLLRRPDSTFGDYLEPPTHALQTWLPESTRPSAARLHSRSEWQSCSARLPAAQNCSSSAPPCNR
eukprot:scaffold142385_cov50-Prasinocladus_malaysianus.AAC.3